MKKKVVGALFVFILLAVLTTKSFAASLSVKPGEWITIHTNHGLIHNPRTFNPADDIGAQNIFQYFMQANMVLNGPDYIWEIVFWEDDRVDFINYITINLGIEFDEALIAQYLSQYLVPWLNNCKSTLPVRAFVLGERWEAEAGEISVINNTKIIYKAPQEDYLTGDHIIISHKNFWGTTDLAVSVHISSAIEGVEIASTSIPTNGGIVIGFPVPELTGSVITPFILCEDSASVFPINDDILLAKKSTKSVTPKKPRAVPWPGPSLSHKPKTPPSLLEIVKGEEKNTWSDERWTPLYPVVDKGFEHVHLANSGTKVEITTSLSAKIKGDFPEFGSGELGASFKAGTTLTLNEEAFFTQWTINVSKWMYRWQATRINGKPDWKLVKITKLVSQPKGREYHPKWYAAKDGWRPDLVGSKKVKYWSWSWFPGHRYKYVPIYGTWPSVSSPPNVLWKKALWIPNSWDVYYQ